MAPIAAAVHGAAGRMGRQLLVAIAERDGARIGGAIDAAGHACIGGDVSLLAAGVPDGVRVVDDAAGLPVDVDVLIDFSLPAASLALLERLDRLDAGADAELASGVGAARTRSLPVVIGTTGFDAAGLERLREHARRRPIVFAPNYSVGVTVALSLLADAARALGDDYDVEIVEAHHRHKIDAPSGTALAMGEAVADALGRDLSSCAIYGREGITGARERDTIGFATVRAGDIIGEHTVLFAGNGERIEIAHRATDRMTFARGAVRAAMWLARAGDGAARPAGLHDMRDVLGLGNRGAPIEEPG